MNARLHEPLRVKRGFGHAYSYMGTRHKCGISDQHHPVEYDLRRLQVENRGENGLIGLRHQQCDLRS